MQLRWGQLETGVQKNAGIGTVNRLGRTGGMCLQFGLPHVLVLIMVHFQPENRDCLEHPKTIPLLHVYAVLGNGCARVVNKANQEGLTDSASCKSPKSWTFSAVHNLPPTVCSARKTSTRNRAALPTLKCNQQSPRV